MSLLTDTIKHTRDKLLEYQRTKAVLTRQHKDEHERKLALIEQIADEVCYHTDLRFENKEDRPAILLHVEQVLLAARRKKEAEHDHDYEDWMNGKGRD
jgi:hypothetical protein